jgi:hypothetical protein
MTLSKYALIVLCAAVPAAAQNPISDGERFLYNLVKGNIVKLGGEGAGGFVQLQACAGGEDVGRDAGACG